MIKGSKMSLESRKKISEANLRSGNRPPSRKGAKMPPEFSQFTSNLHKGRKDSEETTKRRIAAAKRGKDNYFWKGGVTPENIRIRMSSEYRKWREAVFERDNYTCQGCGQRGGKLNADHTKRFADYPELRLDLGNGRTLCEPCHKQTPTFGRYAKVS